MAAALLTDFLPTFKTDIMASVDKSMDSGFAKMAGRVADMLGSYDTGVQSQFAAQQAQISDINKRLEDMAKSSKESLGMLQKMDNALSAVEASVPARPIFPDNNFARDSAKARATF